MSGQACTRCRERKIKCGRELPQCRNCSRSEGVICIYQNPTKRVNHLKLLFDSVNRVQDRLTSIESRLSQLTIGIADGNADRNNPYSDVASRPAFTDQHIFDEEVEDDEDDDEEGHLTEITPPLDEQIVDSPVFHSQVNMINYYHGPSSLFSLCSQVRFYVNYATEGDDPIRKIVQAMCENAAAIEPFSLLSEKSVMDLPPKQQVITAIGHFFKLADSTTDIFIQSNLVAKIERLYSQGPREPGDEVWIICFKAIVILILGMEISSQSSNTLFGDLAGSFIPSRVTLITSRLLTTPRLVNVQTLILLSVVAQQFDPPGWSETIFTYACVLARTMGLHHFPLFPPDNSSDETFERAKVVKSLYTRDKYLCTSRGTISWLPNYDCNMASQLEAAVKHRVDYFDQCQLAIIQEDVYRLIHAPCRRTGRLSTADKLWLSQELRSIELRLDQYVSANHILNGQVSYSYNKYPRRVMSTMEFFTTRILALQQGFESRHADQVRADSKASCLLLLMAHGDQESEVVEAFASLTCRTRTARFSSQSGEFFTTESSTVPFDSILDAFSVPAFFVLLKALLDSGQSGDNGNNAEFRANYNLLQKVSVCYNNSTSRMPMNYYHRRVASTFTQLLSIMEILKEVKQHKPGSMSQPISIPEVKVPNALSVSNFSFSPESTSFPWDLASLGPNTSFNLENSANVSDNVSMDWFGQILESTQQSLSWSAGRSDYETLLPRKRSRIQGEPDIW